MTPAEEAWERLNSRLEAVEAQRNRALTDHAVTAADLAIERQKRQALEKKVSELNATLAALVTTQEA